MSLYFVFKPSVKYEKNEGFRVKEKTHLKKKNSFQVFVGSLEFWVDLTGQLVYSGSIAGLYFE